MFPLGLLADGEIAVVAKIKETKNNKSVDKSGEQGRIEDMGLRPGKVVQMLNNKGSGALLIKIDNSRLAIARSMAMKIMVKKEK